MENINQRRQQFLNKKNTFLLFAFVSSSLIVLSMLLLLSHYPTFDGTWVLIAVFFPMSSGLLLFIDGVRYLAGVLVPAPDALDRALQSSTSKFVFSCLFALLTFLVWQWFFRSDRFSNGFSFWLGVFFITYLAVMTTGSFLSLFFGWSKEYEDAVVGNLSQRFWGGIRKLIYWSFILFIIFATVTFIENLGAPVWAVVIIVLLLVIIWQLAER
jgi:hypothetical protein